MNDRAPLAALCAAMCLLGGCYDYHQRSERIGYRAGDAVKANLERETINPFRGSVFDTSGLGKNGSVPKPPLTSSAQGADAADPAATQ